jgi:hypothetical protein
LAETLQQEHEAFNPNSKKKKKKRPDTEVLRMSMRQYRDFLERLLSL